MLTEYTIVTKHSWSSVTIAATFAQVVTSDGTVQVISRDAGEQLVSYMRTSEFADVTLVPTYR